MARFPFPPAPVCLAASLLLGGCATAPDQPYGIAYRPEPARATADLSNPEAGFTAEIWSDAPPPRVGDFLNLKLRVTTDAYLSLYAIHSSGRTSRLLDNQWARGGRTVAFPGPDSPVDFQVSPPSGTETYLLVATQQPMRWLAPADIRQRGSLTELNLTGRELKERLRAALDRQNPYSWSGAELNQSVAP